MPKTMSDIAAPIVLGLLHIPGKSEIRRAEAVGQGDKVGGSHLVGRQNPVLRDRHVVEPRGSCRESHIRKAHGKCRVAPIVIHVVMTVAAVPPPAWQVGLPAQPKNKLPPLFRL